MNLIANLRSKFPTFSNPSLAPDEVKHLEAALKDAFVPVTPRKDFVDRLNRQLIVSAPLTRKEPVMIVNQDQKSRETLLIGIVAFLGAVAIFAAGFRIAVTLFGAAGILAQWLNQKPAKKEIPIHPAV